jgi:hypothetical protein
VEACGWAADWDQPRLATNSSVNEMRIGARFTGEPSGSMHQSRISGFDPTFERQHGATLRAHLGAKEKAAPFRGRL